MGKISYPVRCRIIDVAGIEVYHGVEGQTPEYSKRHVGKTGYAQRIKDNVLITLDDGNGLWGYECWWEPIT